MVADAIARCDVYCPAVILPIWPRSWIWRTHGDDIPSVCFPILASTPGLTVLAL